MRRALCWLLVSLVRGLVASGTELVDEESIQPLGAEATLDAMPKVPQVHTHP